MPQACHPLPEPRRSARMSQPRAMQSASYIGSGGRHTTDGNAAWRLMVACTDGDLATATALLAADPHLANTQFWYEIPLHFAVRENHLDMVRLLLDAGADPSTSSYSYYAWPTLLAIVDRRQHLDLHRFLLAEMRCRFHYDPGFAPVAAAFSAFDSQVVLDLLRDRPHLVHAADAFGYGVIHWCIQTHALHLLDPLIALGADLNHPAADGLLPIQLAITGHYHFRSHRVPEAQRLSERHRVDALLARGAACPLGVAAWMGDAARVNAQLAADPTACQRLEPGGRSPLWFATKGGHRDIVARFLDLGANPNLPEALAPTGAALFEAAAGNRLDLATLLLEHGADPNPTVDSSGNALSIVAYRHPDNASGMQALLRRFGAVAADWDLSLDAWKAFARANDWQRLDAAHDADLTACMDLELLDLILAHDPDFARRLDGRSFRTPSVRFTARADILERLQAHGYDCNRGDWLGRTVLHYAAQFGDVELAHYLLDHGADLHAVELEYGTTPLGIATLNGRLAMVHALLARGADPALPTQHSWARPLTLLPANTPDRAAIQAALTR